MEKVDAVVLAGGRGGPWTEGAPAKAFVELAGRPMVAYVLDALQALSRIGRVVTVGERDWMASRLKATGTVSFAQGGTTLMDSLRLGLQSLGGDPDRPVLVVSGDIPLLTAEILADFLQGCAALEGDFFYPVIPREVVEARFPGMRRTYVTLRDGVFTGGNLALVRPRTVAACWDQASRFIALRKNPWALSRLVGWSFLLKLVARRLTLEEARQKVSDLFGIAGVVVVVPHPEVGVDVDKADDLEFIRRELSLHRRVGTE